MAHIYKPVDVSGKEITVDVISGPNLHTLVAISFFSLEISGLASDVEFEFRFPVHNELGHRQNLNKRVIVTPVSLHKLWSMSDNLEVKGFIRNCPVDRCSDPSLLPPLVFGRYNVRTRTGVVTFSKEHYEYFVSRVNKNPASELLS